MLLNFTVENWMSYQEEATLSVIASRERQYFHTLAKLPKFRSKRALPTLSLYGGNASGKTGILRALYALKRLVTSDEGVDGLMPIIPFRLQDNPYDEPTVFDITFLAEETVYRYTLSATVDMVWYESLETLTDKRSVQIFERDTTAFGEYRFSEMLGSPEYLDFVARSTRSNQTFIYNAISKNIDVLQDVYEWFAETLTLVGVQSNAWTFARATDKINGFSAYAEETLARLDTGIVGLSGMPVDMDDLPQDARLLRNIADLEENEMISLVIEKPRSDYGFEMFSITKQDGRPYVERMSTLHRGANGKVYTFKLGSESSGTKRLMGLLPMLFDLQHRDLQKSKVYVVDELDRCLHTMLTRKLIQDFLATCNESTRKQLIFTTHDLLLMDQSLLRRDEMYITQRSETGSSELIGLVEYEGIRYDKDLIKSYLEGRFGGIPMIREDAYECEE